ncbi:CPBP family intramembrane metalloprotease [Chryseobacterium sp. SSA4.19]|uniref:CPBP family intramembrane glutamic endopeptidase n=1 Tax=Chryseobacterium sp. SSA4.19 TaxID=2919915 RepID=UPI001F4DCBED|nr:CPBP family intramembrane glutamic endopeptidase [Chryseobacterium sp. SSA4.19]MCJ8154996.1 CPBP family intramembrane metalloprotease [Chryseobacterium sp. SSA4.19]
MKNFFRFLSGDLLINELVSVQSKIKFTVIMIPMMFIIILFSSLLQLLFVHWEIIDPIKSQGMIPSYMKSMSTFEIVLEIALLAPLLEETAFRGPLQNNPLLFKVALVSLTYLIICRIADLNFYKLSLPTAGVLAISFLNLLISKKIIARIIYNLSKRIYRTYFILASAIAFGLWHYYNFDFSHSSFLTIIICLLPFTLNGLLFSYVAVKNGLLWSFILHTVNNLWPLILWL